MIRRTFIVVSGQWSVVSENQSLTDHRPLTTDHSLSVVYSEDRIGIVLVSNLINLFAAVHAHEQTVREIDDDADAVSDVAISVHHTFGDKHGFRIVRADEESHDVAISL